MRTLRLLGIGWLFHFKMIMRSAFDGIGQVIYPLFFATVAFFVFRAGDSPRTLLYASLGAAVMGMWSATSTTAGSAMQRERWQGTLEALVATPTNFALILLPVTIAMATIGIYSLVATLLWGRLLFGIHLTLVHPLLFVLSIPATVLTFGALGFLFAVCFVRFRAAWALGNMFEYPVWLICGFLVPLTFFPDWVRPISWILAPTWGMNAIRESSLGGSPLPDLLMCFVLGTAYIALGFLVMDRLAQSRPRTRCALADVNSVRLFFVGGLTSYRALFYWLSPTIYIPSLIVAPIFQILLFAYIGRSAGLQSDVFYVTGNAIQYAAIPCLFAMSQTVSGERFQNTLSAILVSPAKRFPLFVGRALPVMGNAAFVSAFSFAAGCIILGVSLPAGSIPGLAVVILVAAFSCTGLGLTNAAVSLRVRENAVLSNVIFGFLLIFTGANVPISELPGWMQDVSHVLPLTHAIQAARDLAAGEPFSDVTGLLATELGIGLTYLAGGLVLLRVFEWQGRKHATLEQL